MPNTDMKFYVGESEYPPADVQIRNLKYNTTEEIIENWGPEYTIDFDLKVLVRYKHFVRIFVPCRINNRLYNQ